MYNLYILNIYVYYKYYWLICIIANVYKNLAKNLSQINKSVIAKVAFKAEFIDIWGLKEHTVALRDTLLLTITAHIRAIQTSAEKVSINLMADKGMHFIIYILLLCFIYIAFL